MAVQFLKSPVVSRHLKTQTEPERLKQPGLFDGIVNSLGQVLSLLPDTRTGMDIRYRMEDAGLSAFSVFFRQTPPIPAYQQMMMLGLRRVWEKGAKVVCPCHDVERQTKHRVLPRG